MANSWLRLWHSLPTDPKFRTIATLTGRPISLVLSIYIYLLCEASQNDVRGVTQCDAETIATNFNVTIDDVNSIIDAMQDRLLDGKKIKNWEKRQVAREDNSIDRTRAYRDRKKLFEVNVTQCDASDDRHIHDVTNVTLDKDKDKDKDKNIIDISDEISIVEKVSKLPNCPYEQIVNMYHDTLPTVSRVIALSPSRKRAIQARWRENPNLEIFKMLFTHVSHSPFLLGQVNSPNRAPFKISIDWIMHPSNFLKILEGKYFE